MIDRLVLPTTVLTPEELNTTINWGETIQRGVDYAILCQEKVRGLTATIQGLFIERGRWLWKVRTYELWRYLGDDGAYTSFDAWAADPEQNLNPSSANLAAQVIELFTLFYRIHPKQLYDIGEKKLMLLTPTVQKIADSFVKEHGSNRLDWQTDSNDAWLVYLSDRKVALWLLESARALSWSDLADTIDWKFGGIETYYRGDLSIGNLRMADSILGIMDMLGLSDLPNDAVISVVLKSKKARKNRDDNKNR